MRIYCFLSCVCVLPILYSSFNFFPTIYNNFYVERQSIGKTVKQVSPPVVARETSPTENKENKY